MTADANYYILLEQPSQLKYLSLNRCKINDEVCKKIFENIKFNAPAANSLQLLELGSNDITDDAAIFIGSVLRTNRCLLHLNLSGNKITDSGFLPILDSLMEFQLNFEEKCAASRRKIKYLQSKEAIYEKCLANLKLKKNDDLINITGRKKSGPKPKVSVKTLEEQADIMTKGILGKIKDPFSSDEVVVKNDATYSKGNSTLCYINIAYNHLEYPSVQRLHNVLQYQDEMREGSQSGAEIKGLIKVTLDGNRIPTTCPLLNEIIFYLKNVIYLRTSYKISSKISSKKLCIRNMSTINTPLRGAKVRRAPKYKRRQSNQPSPEVPLPDSSLEFKLNQEKDKFLLTAVYDSAYELEEILMSKYSYAPIPRVLMQVIALRVPFLYQLTKFTIKQCCIDMYTIYELNKILGISNITDICLDHSPLKEANYDILLSDASSLRNLSLSMCNLNDIVCERIASRLHHLEPAEPTLLALNLSSNHITDVGLKYLGEAFRTNRHLRYLNLAGNLISDDGAKYILDVLAEFPLKLDEIQDKNKCYVHYLKNKEELYRKYMSNLVINAKKSNRRSTSVRVRGKGKPTMKRHTFADEYLNMRARAMALEAVGPFEYPFSPSMVIAKRGQSHCIGNFTLCYLNLRYNNLTYESVQRLGAVVRHQMTYRSEKLCGLQNVLLEGNNVPEIADEYEMFNQAGVGIKSKPSEHADEIMSASRRLVRRKMQ